MGFIASKKYNWTVVKEKTYMYDHGKWPLCIVRVTYDKYNERYPYCGHVERGGNEVSAGRAKTKSKAWSKAYKKAKSLVPRDQKHML